MSEADFVVNPSEFGELLSNDIQFRAWMIHSLLMIHNQLVHEKEAREALKAQQVVFENSVKKEMKSLQAKVWGIAGGITALIPIGVGLLRGFLK